MESTQDVLTSNSTFYTEAELRDRLDTFSKAQLAQIFFALWLGALSLDILYYIVFDFELILFTPGWKVTIKAVTRISYLLSRLAGAVALLICLFFLSLDWSEQQCRILPYVFQCLLLVSYLCTLLILCFRTLALYSSNSKLDRFVQWTLGLGIVNVAAWTLVHLKAAKGDRAMYTETRCEYHERDGGPMLVIGLLTSTVVLNLFMFSLTFYKMYISGTHNFFNGRTFLTRWIGRRDGARKQDHLSANHLASSLITQGLYAFFILLIVDVAALLSSLLLSSTYQLMAIISLGSFSSVLGAAVFRETTRASAAIQSLARVEFRLQEAQAQVEEKKAAHRQPSSTEKASHSHYRFHPDLDTGLHSFDGHYDSTRSSLDSKGFNERPMTMVSVFDDEADETTSKGSSNQQTSLGMLSLHAFDGGAPTASKDQDTETLGEVSILGSSWAQNVSKRTSRGLKKLDSRDQPSSAFKTKELLNDGTEAQSLPPPLRRKRKDGHSHYSSRIQSANSSQESFASVSTNPPSFTSPQTTVTIEQKEEIRNAPPFI